MKNTKELIESGQPTEEIVSSITESGNVDVSQLASDVEKELGTKYDVTYSTRQGVPKWVNVSPKGGSNESSPVVVGYDSEENEVFYLPGDGTGKVINTPTSTSDALDMIVKTVRNRL